MEQPRAEQNFVEAEQRYRSVVDHVVDAIITIDERGNIESFNPAAEKLFGYERSEVTGQNVKMLMPEPYHSEHDTYIHNYLSTGRPKIIGIGREVIGRRKDGTTFPMELAVSEFHLGERRYFTGIVRDITERKRLESELRERLEELAQADRQKNEFLAMLSHELRNPLAPMRNALHLIKRAQHDPEAMQTARDVMDRQMHQLVRLVDDLLDVSRIIRGKIDLRRQRVDIAAVVNRAMETAQPTIDGYGHELNLSLPAHSVWVKGDLVRLAQVISNLLMNAAKYSGKANRISVSVRDEADAAVISVRDYGAGIPAQLLPRVFDLFVQGENTLARAQGGLGIGLTLVKRLVEMHGGSVSASSEGPGKGSEFCVRLPLAAASDATSTTRAAAAAAAETPKHIRLLVVDDNVDAAETIAQLLRLAGYEASCVYDGPAALAAVESKRPDIVVVDIGLPGMDGYEVARQLRARPGSRGMPLIAVTGYGQENDRQRSIQAGFDEHFTKPVDPEALESFIARLAVRSANAQPGLSGSA
jgi:PAS domain S-box-containing protein